VPVLGRGAMGNGPLDERPAGASSTVGASKARATSLRELPS
jgi:hypothetical protein